MANKWVEAGGEYQVPFILAARLVFQGEPVQCPKCDGASIRYYFHILNPVRGHGTIWAWCPNCFTKCHLPRVSPLNVTQTDPFADFTDDQFIELELDTKEPFQDRLNRLWDEGELG